MFDDGDETQKSWQEVISGKGGHCPTCHRWGKIYARILNNTMAKSLIWLCQEKARTQKDWVDVPNTAPRFVIRSNQLPILATWGLVERCPKTQVDGKQFKVNSAKYSGLWRPTLKGWDFYHDRIKVPQRAFTYNNVVLKYGDQEVSLQDCFETLFDYNQVMMSNFDD
jgi:hypothetical protein